MKIVKNEYETICDVKGCTRMAEYRLIMDVASDGPVCMCMECLKEFNREASKKIKAEERKNAKKDG